MFRLHSLDHTTCCQVHSISSNVVCLTLVCVKAWFEQSALAGSCLTFGWDLALLLYQHKVLLLVTGHDCWETFATVFDVNIRNSTMSIMDLLTTYVEECLYRRRWFTCCTVGCLSCYTDRFTVRSNILHYLRDTRFAKTTAKCVGYPQFSSRRHLVRP